MRILSVATHSSHIFHPFNVKKGLEKATLFQRISGITLYIFAGLLTLGISVIFYSALAARKIKHSTEPDMFDRVKKAAAEGYTGLFIGRRDDQSVPGDDNVQWFTLDIDKVTDKKSHLHMDFNDLNKMKRLKGLFDGVLLDVAVMKHVHGAPWIRLKELLKPLPSSILVTEVFKGVIAYPLEEPGPEEIINGNLMIPLDKMADKEEYMARYEFDVTEHLRTLFSHVELKNEQFPGRDEDTHTRKHFVMKGPI